MLGDFLFFVTVLFILNQISEMAGKLFISVKCGIFIPFSFPLKKMLEDTNGWIQCLFLRDVDEEDKRINRMKKI